MRLDKLDVRELLDFHPQGGIIRFAGERAIILDALALGLLRKELVHTIGPVAARGILTRFGYAHGWRTAEIMRRQFPWRSLDDWRQAGGRLHRLQGLVLFEPVVRALTDQQREPRTPDTSRSFVQPFAQAIWHESYESEQHLLHLGRADEPVCWSLVGFASGYLSCAHDRDVLCIERTCRGRGDSTCTMIGNPRDTWGPEMESEWAFYDSDCLNTALAQLTRTLAKTQRKLRATRKSLDDVAGTKGDRFGDIVARSEAMDLAMRLAHRAAHVDVRVLITGESGVGKERVARFIHQRSARADKPFIAINCGALSETLLESELFGHARGAFTGAQQERIGLFEAAHTGTLFLDEIGELSLTMQVRLLRVLAEGEIRRVGDNRPRRIDVRVLAATHRSLTDDVDSGRFRQDLLYRLRVLEISLKPLRERTDDILPLARRFMATSAKRMGKTVTSISARAADQLIRYHWPGNIRELQNAIERALVITDTRCIDVTDLPEEVRMAVAVPKWTGTIRPLADIERDYILAVLSAHDGNRTKTAQALKIGRSTLLRKLSNYGHPSDSR